MLRLSWLSLRASLLLCILLNASALPLGQAPGTVVPGYLTEALPVVQPRSQPWHPWSNSMPVPQVNGWAIPDTRPVLPHIQIPPHVVIPNYVNSDSSTPSSSSSSSSSSASGSSSSSSASSSSSSGSSTGQRPEPHRQSTVWQAPRPPAPQRQNTMPVPPRQEWPHPNQANPRPGQSPVGYGPPGPASPSSPGSPFIPPQFTADGYQADDEKGPLKKKPTTGAPGYGSDSDSPTSPFVGSSGKPLQRGVLSKAPLKSGPRQRGASVGNTASKKIPPSPGASPGKLRAPRKATSFNKNPPAKGVTKSGIKSKPPASPKKTPPVVKPMSKLAPQKLRPSTKRAVANAKGRKAQRRT